MSETDNKNKNKSQYWHSFLVRLYQGCSIDIKVEKSGTKKENFANLYIQMGNNL